MSGGMEERVEDRVQNNIVLREYVKSVLFI